MKYYKSRNNQIYAYEDDVPEYGSYTEVEQEIPLEEGDEHYGEEGYEDATKVVIIKIPNEITVKKDLILITKDEADIILKEQEEANKPTDEEIRANMKPLSRFQATSVLELTPYNDTNLLNATDEYFNNLVKDSLENTLAINAWKTAIEFRRNSPMILKLQEKFGLTDEQVDTMFERGLSFEM